VVSDQALAAEMPFNETKPLDRVRVDDSDRTLTTDQAVKVGNDQDSLKIGLRGPTAMEDFIFREKITHFDHKRIPERVVHARGRHPAALAGRCGRLGPGAGRRARVARRVQCVQDRADTPSRV
jgi:hypothetical protein